MVDYSDSARTENKGLEFFRLAQASRPKRFESRDHHLLGQVVCGLAVPQMSQPVKTNARYHPPTKFGFGFTVACLDLAGEAGAVEFSVHSHIFYV